MATLGSWHAMSKTKSVTEFQNMLHTAGLSHLQHMFDDPQRMWTTAAAFAFAAGHHPNTVPPERLSKFVVRPLLGLAPGNEDEDEQTDDGVAIRELFFDCSCMVLAEKTRQFEQGPNGQIGQEDRAQKRPELEKQLFPGIVCEGLFSHADHTENCFREMLQPGTNRFWHIPLHECIAADQELALGLGRLCGLGAGP